jgi:hypothetical protein
LLISVSGWSEIEAIILLYYEIRGYSDQELRQKLLEKAGTTRTLDSVRSKLAELRKDTSLFDLEKHWWIIGEIYRRVHELPGAIYCKLVRHSHGMHATTEALG